MTEERSGFLAFSCEFEVFGQAKWDDLLEIWIKLVENSGVKLTYRFEISKKEQIDDSQTPPAAPVIAMGEFVTVCCRFSADEPPRAHLDTQLFLQKTTPINRPNRVGDGEYLLRCPLSCYAWGNFAKNKN